MACRHAHSCSILSSLRRRSSAAAACNGSRGTESTRAATWRRARRRRRPAANRAGRRPATITATAAAPARSATAASSRRRRATWAPSCTRRPARSPASPCSAPAPTSATSPPTRATASGRRRRAPSTTSTAARPRRTPRPTAWRRASRPGRRLLVRTGRRLAVVPAHVERHVHLGRRRLAGPGRRRPHRLHRRSRLDVDPATGAVQTSSAWQVTSTQQPDPDGADGAAAARGGVVEGRARPQRHLQRHGLLRRLARHQRAAQPRHSRAERHLRRRAAATTRSTCTASSTATRSRAAATCARSPSRPRAICGWATPTSSRSCRSARSGPTPTSSRRDRDPGPAGRVGARRVPRRRRQHLRHRASTTRTGIYVASYGNGLAYLAPGNYAPTYWSAADKLPQNYLTGVVVDPTGDVWIATASAGVVRYQPSSEHVGLLHDGVGAAVERRCARSTSTSTRRRGAPSTSPPTAASPLHRARKRARGGAKIFRITCGQSPPPRHRRGRRARAGGGDIRANR